MLYLADHAKDWSSTIGRLKAHEIAGETRLLTLCSSLTIFGCAADLSVAPISASVNAPAIQGFLLMHVNHVSGIAVCDEHGALEANLSASDLKVGVLLLLLLLLLLFLVVTFVSAQDVSYLNTFVPTTFRDLFLPLRSFLLKKAGRGNTVHSVP